MADAEELTRERGEWEEAIGLRQLLEQLARHIWLLVVAGGVGAAVAGGLTYRLVVPQYEASSMIYIFSKTTSITSLTDLQVGTQLTEDFQILGMSRPVVEAVRQKLNLADTYEELTARVSIDNLGSRILRITVRDADPEQAAEISNAMADALRDRIAEVLNTDRPTTVERAIPPLQPSGAGAVQYGILGGLLGVFGAAAGVLFRFLADDTIRTGEDVRRYLGMSVLAQLPLDRTAHHTTALSPSHRVAERRGY